MVSNAAGNFAGVIKEAVSSKTKYSKGERDKLKKLFKIARESFHDGYHSGVFAELGIRDNLPDVAVADFEFIPFRQNSSHVFDSETKQIAEILERYISSPRKSGTNFRVGKVICVLLHKITVQNLSKGRYDTPEEAEKRILEVHDIQNWICQVIESQAPSFVEDNDFLGVLDEANALFDEIDEILEKKKNELKKQDILSGFEGKEHLKSTVDNTTEYISSLPGNKPGFSASRLFRDALKHDSDVQRFLVATEIGKATTTLLLSSQSAQGLFLSTPDISLLHRLFEESSDPSLDINKALWDERATKDLIIDSLICLDKLSHSGEISGNMKAGFSGVMGNGGLLMPGYRQRTASFFSMTSDVLLELRSLLKSLNESVLRLETITSTKKTKIRRLFRTSCDVIDGSIKDYNKVALAINEAPPPEVLAQEFRNRMISMEAGISAFQSAVLPLLPPERRYPYQAITQASAMPIQRQPQRALLQLEGGDNASAELQEVVVERQAQVAVVSPQANGASGGNTIFITGGILQSAIKHILETQTRCSRGCRRLVEDATFIGSTIAKLSHAFDKQENSGLVPIEGEEQKQIQAHIQWERAKTNLKTAGAVAGGVAGPLAFGGGVAFAIHNVEAIALTGFWATAPWGLLGAAAGYGVVGVAIGGVAIYRVSNTPAEERADKGAFSLWLDECSKCFTFADERIKNDGMYHDLCNWSCSLTKCTMDLIGAVKDQEDAGNINFALEVLDLVISYEADKDCSLVKDFNPERDAQRLILNQCIKLRYVFVNLFQEGALRFPERVETKASKTQVAREIFADSSIKLDKKDDKTAIETAKGTFLLIICSTKKHLQELKKQEVERNTPSTSFASSSADQVAGEVLFR